MGRISFFIILCLVLSGAGSARSDVKEQLQGIKREISEKKQLLKKNRKVENKVSSELEDIGETLREKESNLALLTRDLKGVESKVENTEAEIDKVKTDAEAKKRQITRRVSSLYKAGDVGSVQIIFSSGSIPRLMENQRYMRAILDYDRALYLAYNEKIERLKVLKQNLETDVARKEKIKENIEVKKREIEAEKREKSAYLGKIREDKQRYLASIKELEANARRLQIMVERLEARARKSYTRKDTRKPSSGGPSPSIPDRGFGSLKGRLSIPARGEIVEGFGRHKHPDFNSFTYSNGISIAAAQGADVRAVYDGQVIFADYFKGYGNMVIVDHGGGFFSLYAHTARVTKKVGANVAKNEVIACVGDVDSPKGPMLYFEIRYQGKPVDPAPWFR
jgi:septal ring factor EnvC (AmiA/AmiB activator)